METDNFKIITSILSALDRQMDKEEVDKSAIDADSCDASPERWRKLMKMLNDDDYIRKFKAHPESDGTWTTHTRDVRITLKGLEYLRHLQSEK
jgi:hypothetical protein